MESKKETWIVRGLCLFSGREKECSVKATSAESAMEIAEGIHVGFNPNMAYPLEYLKAFLAALNKP